jgi:uncharacterized protein (TIGR02246 family)
MTVLEPAALAGKFAEHINRADPDAALELYEPDATFVQPDGSAVTGRAEIHRVLAEMVAARAHISGVVGDAAVIGDDLALLCNRWQLTFGTLDGAPAMDGASVEVARRQPDGGWLYAIDSPRAAAG